jgi:hypothetical protein
VLRQPQTPDVTRRQKPLLLYNGGGKYLDVSRRMGLYAENVHLGRGLAVGDIDSDGWVDVVISHLNERVAILQNTTARTSR